MFLHVDKGFDGGFQWAWNHLLSHCWRMNKEATGDERFLDRMLADFRRMCANDNRRLKAVAQQIFA